MALGSSVRWWKMLQVMLLETDSRGHDNYLEVGRVELQDDNKGPALAGDWTIVSGSTPPEYFELRFWKAKALGVHTDMEHWVIPGRLILGKRITFTWESE
jgi:hypothetical protein